MKRLLIYLVFLSSFSGLSEVSVKSFAFERTSKGDKTYIVVSTDKTSNVKCTIFDKNDKPITVSEGLVTPPLSQLEIPSNMAMITSVQCHELENKYDTDSNDSLMLDEQLNMSQKDWVDSIALKVIKYWRFAGARSDWYCYVYITQDRVGNLNAVDIDNCGDSIMNIDDNPKLRSFKNSIERAVYEASPLPFASTEDVFSEQIIFEFRVDAVEIM